MRSWRRDGRGRPRWVLDVQRQAEQIEPKGNRGMAMG